jgi:hypothetical protein
MDEVEANTDQQPTSLIQYDLIEPTLFVTDEEMIRRLGVPRKAARAATFMLDRDLSKGFPPKVAVWGKRRYWPAVKAWFDRHYGGPFLRSQFDMGRRSGV